MNFIKFTCINKHFADIRFANEFLKEHNLSPNTRRNEYFASVAKVTINWIHLLCMYSRKCWHSKNLIHISYTYTHIHMHTFHKFPHTVLFRKRVLNIHQQLLNIYILINCYNLRQTIKKKKGKKENTKYTTTSSL